MGVNISLSEISNNLKKHSSDTQWYQDMKGKLRLEIEKATNVNQTKVNLEGIGLIALPIYSMGNITSIDLFGLDEMILFSFYKQRKQRGLALDLGANIGLHSIVLSKLGYRVLAIEPDPMHIKEIKKNLRINHVESVQVIEKAVSSRTGSAEFIRILGNTTGSHLAGSLGKQPYGEIYKFQVETVAIYELLSSHPDTTLVKMDVEGFEAELICSLESQSFVHVDFLLEVGSQESARRIYEYLNDRGVHACAQKIGWEKVSKLEEMPISYKEGSLLIPRQG